MIKIAVLACVVFSSAAYASSDDTVYAVQPAESAVSIEVGRAGLFKFAGHTHEVVAPIFRGEVVADPIDLQRCSVWIEFDAAALKVTGKGEPAKDVPKVQENMVGPKVLDVAKYPAVAFRSRSVRANQVASNVYDLEISGEMSLHGTTRGFVLPLRAELSADTLIASGRTILRHTDFGMRPLSVAGVVNVKNEIAVAFRIVARRIAARPPP